MKITVIATGFNQDGRERVRETFEHNRTVDNVIPLTPGEKSKSIDYQRISSLGNLDEPAFKRYGAE